MNPTIKLTICRNQGFPSPITLVCLCGERVDISSGDDPVDQFANMCESCGREYDQRGYLTFDPVPA